MTTRETAPDATEPIADPVALPPGEPAAGTPADPAAEAAASSEGPAGVPGRRRRRPPWWVFGLLLLAAAATVAIVLLTRGGGGPSDTRPDGKQREDKAGVGTARNLEPGVIRTTEGDRLLPPPDDGSLDEFDGAKVLAHAVTVESVESAEGFWIGEPEARVFVLVKGAEANGALGVSPGDEVTFRGKLRAVEESDLDRFGVSSAGGADLLLEQGHYVKVGAKHIEIE